VRALPRRFRHCTGLAILTISHMPKSEICWPHAPLHQLSQAGTYFLTASTYNKQHYFRGDDRLTVLERGLLRVAQDFGWQIEAWAIFSNHYHFIAHSPEQATDASNLSQMLGVLHTKTGRWINGLDNTRGRQVWHNFWETRLTYQTSYLARLNYVHQNAVKHGLALTANQNRWCSAAWFERTASTSLVKSIYGFNIDKVKVHDEFEPIRH
jgi:putative transposase